MSVTLLGGDDRVLCSMRMSAVAMAVIVEEEKADDVRCQTEGTDDKHELRMGDLQVWLDKPLDRFKKDR